MYTLRSIPVSYNKKCANFYKNAYKNCVHLHNNKMGVLLQNVCVFLCGKIFPSNIKMLSMRLYYIYPQWSVNDGVNCEDELSRCHEMLQKQEQDISS